MSMLEQTLDQWLTAISSRTPTPGGGSVAAVTGAMGAGLCAMALEYTRGRKSTDEELDGVLVSVLGALADLRQRLMHQAEEDAAAYQSLRDAHALPKEGDAEARSQAIEVSLANATESPMRIVRLCRDGLEMIEGLHPRLNRHLATDAGAGASLLLTGAATAALNVRVNLKSVGDSEPATSTRAELDRLLDRCRSLHETVLAWTASCLDC